VSPFEAACLYHRLLELLPKIRQAFPILGVMIDSYRERVELLEQDRCLDERLKCLDERLRRGLRRMETGRLSGLRVGDP
jgi:hypothetical protein